MTEEILAEGIRRLGVSTITGIPDSTLKHFCNYIQASPQFSHQVCANEGSALGIAIGSYLATGRPACVYLQNSGLGNLVNPYSSLAHREVYGVPMLFVIGWRGDDTGRDEPQHKFMGRATLPLLKLLEIPYAVLDRETSEVELNSVLQKAAETLCKEEAFAIVVKRGTFEEHPGTQYQNSYHLTQEEIIISLLNSMCPEDVLVSTTGKISRELYEKLEIMPERKGQAFLTVGGMGFASSIAMGIAKEEPKKRVYCLDGDGAALMHMGTLAIAGSCAPRNFVHVCLNNQSFESVGGMPTGVFAARYSSIAQACGYRKVWFADNRESLAQALAGVKHMEGPVFIEVGLALSARKDLGRPKESARENKNLFRSYHWKEEAE